MLILGIDFETSGSPDKPPFLPTELGLILMEIPSYRIIRTQSFIINPEVQVDQFILDLTHLTQEQINQGLPRRIAAEYLCDAMSPVGIDAVLTWNGDEFDRPLAQQELNQFTGQCAMPPWIDLKIDGKFRHKLELAHAAADLGYLNASPHTALGDVLTMFEVARRSNFDFAVAVQNAQHPYVEVLAQVSMEKRDQANVAGYRWAPERKIWVRKVRENLIDAEAKLRPFIVSRVPVESVKEPSQSKGNQ